MPICFIVAKDRLAPMKNNVRINPFFASQAIDEVSSSDRLQYVLMSIAIINKKINPSS